MFMTNAGGRQVLGGRAGSYSMGLAIPVGQQIVFISGQIPVDASGNLVGPDDLTAQTRDVFDKIKALVEEAGGSLGDVVKITTFLTDMSRFAEFARVREEVFAPNFPASSSVEVSALVRPGLLVEVEAIAIV
jgi:reactive intermediate/imine deaminase